MQSTLWVIWLLVPDPFLKPSCEHCAVQRRIPGKKRPVRHQVHQSDNWQDSRVASWSKRPLPLTRLQMYVYSSVSGTFVVDDTRAERTQNAAETGVVEG